MLNLIKNFFIEEDGLGTVEIVIIIAVLVGLALIFRTQMFSFVNQIFASIFSDTKEVVKQPAQMWDNTLGQQPKSNP